MERSENLYTAVDTRSLLRSKKAKTNIAATKVTLIISRHFFQSFVATCYVTQRRGSSTTVGAMADGNSGATGNDPRCKKRRKKRRSKKGKSQSQTTSWDFIPVASQRAKHANDCARPSVFLPLGAADFSDKFAKVFEEHIPGFSGLGKRVKDKDKDKRMEWRVRLAEKKGGGAGKDMAAARLHAIAQYKALKKARQSVLGKKKGKARVQ